MPLLLLITLACAVWALWRTRGGLHRPFPVHTDKAPAAIGPYSQAMCYGPWLFSSGQIGLDLESGIFVSEDVVPQTRQALDNLKAVLAAAGLALTDVVQVSIFLVDMDDFAEVNDVYSSYFTNIKPARATVAVRQLPKNARVEISCIAVRSGG